MNTELSVKNAEQMDRMAPREVRPSSVFIMAFPVLTKGKVSKYSYSSVKYNGRGKNY